VTAGADINRDLGQGWTPLAHAIDIESDAAWQRHHEPGRTNAELTEMLLKAGAIPTERAFELASAYGNEKVLVLLRSYTTGTGPK
jgi:hypothetical protein